MVAYSLQIAYWWSKLALSCCKCLDCNSLDISLIYLEEWEILIYPLMSHHGYKKQINEIAS